MKTILIKLLAAKLTSSNDNGKSLKIIAGLFLFLIFLPLIILQCLNPFSLFNNDKSNDIYIKVQQKIQSEKNVTIDIDLMRAVDTALFSSSIDENSIEYRANRYYYHTEKTTEEVDEKQPDGTTKKVKKTKIVYVANDVDQVMTALKKDMTLSDAEINSIKELYQILLASDDNGDDGGVTGNYKFTGTQAEFIKMITPAVIKISKQYGLFPSVTFAQAILESGAGKSKLASQYKNLFGIKADSGWSGPKVRMATGEEYGGKEVTIMDYFRVYSTWDGSIEDHAKFLKNNSRYTQGGVFSASNYQQQASALQRSGYATEHDYAALLIKIIQDNKLYQYDN